MSVLRERRATARLQDPCAGVGGLTVVAGVGTSSGLTADDGAVVTVAGGRPVRG